MATKQDIERDRELLKGMGLPEVRIWPPKADWYDKDGGLHPNLPCDAYSRGVWLKRGFRPALWGNKQKRDIGADIIQKNGSTPIDLVDALVELGEFYGTASQLHDELAKATSDLPVDATRLSKRLGQIEYELSVKGIGFERIKTPQKRYVRLSRR